MKVLIVNAGSSSLKYQLVDMDNEQMIVKGQVERIAIEGSHLNQKTPDMSKVIDLYEPIPDHVVATKLMLRALLDPEKGVLKSVDEIGAVGHRVLHGGEEFTASCIITDEVKAAIRKFIPLGPLHNPANLMGIEACEEVMPHTPQVAVFDTAFHQTMPPKAFMYGVPYRYYKEMGVRRYGFHGTSHRYVSKPRDRLPSRQRFFPVRRQGRQVPGYLHGSDPSGRRCHGHAFWLLRSGGCAVHRQQ